MCIYERREANKEHDGTDVCIYERREGNKEHDGTDVCIYEHDGTDVLQYGIHEDDEVEERIGRLKMEDDAITHAVIRYEMRRHLKVCTYGRKKEMKGEREGGRDEWRERGREGGMKGGREGGREG